MTASTFVKTVAAVVAVITVAAAPVRAETLCDPSYQDCRSPLLTLIQNEKVGIDVAFWFMDDSRYASAIIARWNAGVPVRVLVDPRGDAGHPENADIRSQLTAAGIPIRKRTASGILHWKTMLFAGQNVVEFGGANYSPFEFVPTTPYANYEDESILFTDDPAVVNSFKTKWDDLWTDTANYTNYANVTTLSRIYPTYTIDSELNFPPGQDYANRSVSRYNAETQKIDVTMFRITDQRHTNAIIAAFGRGVPVRLITEQEEYRNPARLWDAWNVDRLYAAGVSIRQRAHTGLNHQKSVILYGQGMTIFGSSNWTSPSANSQQEHNYFTIKPAIFQWFVDQFERKWNNTNPAGTAETQPFVPLPPDKPVLASPANMGTGVATSGVVLKWDGGPWAHFYDVYFGTDPNPPLFAANQPLGPDDPTKSPKQYQTLALPTLSGGTTYYWKIVSKTMASLTAAGPVWSFTTTGAPPPPPPPPNGATTIVLWASNTPSGSIVGNWQPLGDTAASGGSAMWNPDHTMAKISPALANPSNYFEQTFTVYSGTAYHLWVRLRAQNNSLSNDSVHVQFTNSVDALNSPLWQIGTSSSAEVVLEAGSADPSVNGYGWSDNGWGSLGTNVYFATPGTETVRVQQREDGAIVDEIVLSPDTYLSTPPGAHDNDRTILPVNDGSSTPPPPPPPDIVLWTANTSSGSVVGNWQMLGDTTAAGGAALWNPDAGQAKIAPALASPSNYFEETFTAKAGTAYHLWVRLRAQNNSLSNDSVHLQFSDAVDSSGTAVMGIGTTSSAEVVLQNGPQGAADHAWGWADNGWGVLGVNVYFATTGAHTIRIQQREDGAIVDQIVLSPGKYLSTPPGPRLNDATILSSNSGS